MNIGSMGQTNYRRDDAGYAAAGIVKTDAFYNGFSSAVEKADGKGTGDILGLTMLPYNDRMSYGMAAQYSEKSTAEDPVIRISSNYGGEQRYYDVHVNEVNPRNASQLEMFALSCYMDDKGMTDGGILGSYRKMKVYADNAAYHGLCPDLQNSSNISVKLDWVSILKKMSQVYLENAQTYSQYLDADSLAVSLETWGRKYVKKNDEPEAAFGGKETETKSDIIVKPDGSRVLVVTMNIGGMETTMSLEISKPTNMQNDTSKQNKENSSMPDAREDTECAE